MFPGLGLRKIHYSIKINKNMCKLIIFGKKGFFAQNLKKTINLNKYEPLFIGSDDIDLTCEKSSSKLSSFNEKKYNILFFSCLTPDRGKDENIFIKNISMIKNFFKFFNKQNISHFYYISSDAVYDLNQKKINEKTITNPQDLYGIMHMVREKIVLSYLSKENVTILRPTLTIGKGDTHNSYGPNRFVKNINESGEITIFNLGKDKRDFIHILDLLQIIKIFIDKKISGVFNVATGKSYSFIDIANKLKKIYPKEFKIKHSGNSKKFTIRQFHIKELKKNIKGFSFQSLDKSLEKLF